MSDDNQFLIPPSFVELFVEPGRIKPSASRAEIAERYDFCEDLAQMLTEHARTQFWDLGITEADVLERMLRGLRGPDAAVSAREARWVVRRLAELLDWQDPGPEPEPQPDPAQD